ncbi:MAG: hypothetical protein IKM97_00655 [Clostridia bacterium]|nr:hypothetical protein [Clostridia bacterium]
MEKVLSGEDKIRRAEEIYYRRKSGNFNTRLSKADVEKKSYLGSKILLEILLIINLSIIIMCIQNKNYIFTEKFLLDIQNYNINLTRNLKELIGIDSKINENIEESNIQNIVDRNKEEKNESLNLVEESNIEEIVPNNEGDTSSLNEMDEVISKIKQIVEIKKPINEGMVTSRFGIRESIYKNVEGYHTGIDIGATKGTSIYSAMSRNS